MKIDMLCDISQRLRRELVDVAILRGGHIASSLSCIDILTALYYGNVLNINPQQPSDENRDRFILSKGHAETALFTVLADKGFFQKKWLYERYRFGDCFLGGHPDKAIPGVEVSTGALGHGLGLACGMAKAALMQQQSQHYFVLMGDAECTEGSVWEAALFAAKQRLSNLTVIVDMNKIGSIDFTKNFTSLDPLEEKWKSFNWDALVCSGHDCEELIEVCMGAKSRNGDRPLVVLAKTVKGKGVSFMENEPIWHVKRLDDPQEVDQAKRELASARDD